MAEYTLMARQIEAVAEIDRDFVPVLSNAAAVLWEGLDRVNWVGFYLMDRGSLLVGPFQGKVACVRIEVGRGVCGGAVRQGRILRVEDVHAFPGHIACDGASRSEIVLPIRSGGDIVGVLDVDSPETGRFTEEDEAGLAEVVEALEGVTDFSRLRLESRAEGQAMLGREDILRVLRGTDLLGKGCWVTSGAALVLHGVKGHTRDVDLVCTTQLADRLEREGVPFRRSPLGDTRIFTVGRHVEVLENWHTDQVETLEGMPVASLGSIRRQKEELGREKDWDDIRLIDAFLQKGGAG